MQFNAFFDFYSVSIAKNEKHRKHIDQMKQEVSDFGLDYSFYDEYLHVLRNIISQELMQLAQQYLNPEDFYTVVAGSKP